MGENFSKILKWAGIIALLSLPIILLAKRREEEESVREDDDDIFEEEFAESA